LARALLGTWDAWLSLFAWALALIAFRQLSEVPAASGYELSIYDVLPPLSLYAFQTSLALHVFVAVRACFRRNWTAVVSLTSLFALTGIIFNSAVALLLPALRGYYALIGDTSSHLSLSTEIANGWNIDKEVFYPALYSLVQIVHSAAGLDISLAWSFGTVVWYILYALLCIMTARRLLGDHRAAMLAGVAAAVPVARAYLRTMFPASVSVYLLPLLFYLYTRARRKEGLGFSVLLVLLLVVLPFLHPLTSLMSILWLALLEMARWTLSRVALRRPTLDRVGGQAGSKPEPLILTASLILAIIWTAWLSTFTLWNRSVQEVARWLAGEAHTQLDKLGYLAGRSGLSTLELIELVFKQESGIIIYTGLVLALLPLCYLLIRRRRLSWPLLRYLVPLYALVAVSILAAGFAVVGPMGGLDFYRFARFLVPWAVLILAAVPLLAELVDSRVRFLIASSVICALVVVALGGFLALHPSPFISEPNDQMTLHELSCMEWISESGDGRDIRGIWGLQRQAEIVLGHAGAELIPSVRVPLPDHFGYDQVSSLTEIFAKPAYFLITEYDRATVLDLWSSVGKYTEEDFRRLAAERAAILLYANGGCDVWALQPSETEHRP
jgi:hypothetical protein